MQNVETKQVKLLKASATALSFLIESKDLVLDGVAISEDHYKTQRCSHTIFQPRHALKF